MVKFSLRWSTLTTLYTSYIGKTTALLGLLSIVSLLPYAREIASSPLLSISILGSFIITICYIFYSANCPHAISHYKSESNYISHFLNLEQTIGADLLYICGDLEKDERSLKLTSLPDVSIEEPYGMIQAIITTLGNGRATYAVSKMHYEFIDTSKKKTRAALSISFCLGVTLLYIPSIFRLIRLFIDGITTK